MSQEPDHKPTAEQEEFAEQFSNLTAMEKLQVCQTLPTWLRLKMSEGLATHDREGEDALLKRFEDLKAEWTRRADIGFRPTGSQCASDTESLIAQIRKERE